jgi:hypothetical protein
MFRQENEEIRLQIFELLEEIGPKQIVPERRETMFSQHVPLPAEEIVR